MKFNNVDSSLLDVLCGVPQGSILGPLLFILYINDIVNVSDLFSFVLFADDTNLFQSGYTGNIENLNESINTELDKLSIWF